MEVEIEEKNYCYCKCRPLISSLHTLKGFQFKKTPSLRLKTLKTIPCSAAHTCISQIREYPPPLGTIFGSFELTYLDQRKHC